MSKIQNQKVSMAEKVGYGLGTVPQIWYSR